MIGSVHVLCKDIEKIYGALVDLGVNRGFQLTGISDDASGNSWTIGLFNCSDDWITVMESQNDTKAVASAIASGLDVFTLGLVVDEPWSWSFFAYDGHERIGQYSWDVPAELVTGLDEKVKEFESEKLSKLGLQGLDSILPRNNSRRQRIGSSDPRIEMRYRSKISGGQLDAPDPVFAPELPRLLHKTTGLSTAARIRKILSTPHISIGAAVTEFGLALDLPNWMDECELNSDETVESSPDRLFFQMIEKV